MLLPGPRNGALLFAISVVTSLALALVGSTEVLLTLSPVLLLAIPLWCGRYLGEERLAKLRLRAARRRQRAPRGSLPRRPVLVLIRGGGRLISAGLAERAPPALAST